MELRQRGVLSQDRRRGEEKSCEAEQPSNSHALREVDSPLFPFERNGAPDLRSPVEFNYS